MNWSEEALKYVSIIHLHWNRLLGVPLKEDEDITFHIHDIKADDKLATQGTPHASAAIVLICVCRYQKGYQLLCHDMFWDVFWPFWTLDVIIDMY